MWYLWLSVALCYIAVSVNQLYQASSPARPCRQGSECFHPLISAGDALVMELWLYQPTNFSSKAYQWTPVESCRFNLTIPVSGILPIDVTSNGTTCMVPLPDVARIRSTDKRVPKPLQAIFRFRPVDNPTFIVGDVLFELTRIVQHKPSILWSGSSSEYQARNLLEEPVARNAKVTAQQPEGPQWIPYLKYGKSAIRIRFVAETRPYGVLERQDGVRLNAWNRTTYRPIIYVDDNSLQRSSKIELGPPEDNRPPVRLSIKIGSLSPMIDSMNQQATLVLQMAEEMMPGSELDEIRYFLQDERLYRFLVTQVISYLHMGVDYMAFRDEISFYRGKQSLAGVSTSSVITRFLCSFIILLYLIDGGGTSWVVLVSLFSSCAVEAWKVWRLLRPTFKPSYPFISIRQLQLAGEQETAEYDRIASTNLALVLYPLVLGWSLYALQHYVYKSWYSWFISNLANAVYTFGFIALCPQLYVNYRLKSVAHLPWKVFVYKIFNTFVDDAFAWLIEMPWKHRIMTLRDDVVFLMLLVQVYTYRVDKTRTNEFGYSYEEEEAAKLEQSARTESAKQVDDVSHEKKE